MHSTPHLVTDTFPPSQVGPGGGLPYIYIYIFGLAQVWWNQRLHVECRSSLQHFVAFRNTGERTNICFHILIALSDFDLHEIFFSFIHIYRNFEAFEN